VAVNSRVHQAEQHGSAVAGIEARTLVSSHHFPRHSHDQFGIGVIDFGAQRSWSGVGAVRASAGDVIMCNPGEMHDGAPLDDRPRGWRMIYFDPLVLVGAVREEFSGPVEMVRPVARDPVLARHFASLFACVTAPRPDGLALEQTLVRSLMCMLTRHGIAPPPSDGRSPCVAKAIARLDSAPGVPVSLAELAALSGVSRFQLLRGFARQVGITPHAYLVQQRVKVARRLLSNGMTPADAAMQAHFSDQSHMTRAFVRYIGVTPGRYRAACGCNLVQDA
jgi:AraC-like DNA-binding protein